jgi:hypothetical protein
MLTKALFLSVAIVAARACRRVLAVSAAMIAVRDRHPQRGGWDGNGPDMLGTAADDRGTRLYLPRRLTQRPAVTGASDRPASGIESRG